MDPATDLDTPATLDAQPLLQSALYSPAAHLRLWGIAGLGLLADLWSKHWAFSTFQGEPKVILEGVLSFQCSYNTGALWGMGKGLSPLFVVASLIALVIVLGVFARSQAGQRSFHLALGMIIAGALGNLYDRLFQGGRVRDFIKIELSLGKLELWPWIFNVADMLLVVGVTILLIHIWLSGKDPVRNRREAESLSADSDQLHA